MKYLILFMIGFLLNILFVEKSISSDNIKYDIYYNGLSKCYLVKESSINVDKKNILVRFLSENIGVHGVGGCGCTSALLKVRVLNANNGNQIAQKVIYPQSGYKLVKIKNSGYKHIEIHLTCYIN